MLLVACIARLLVACTHAPGAPRTEGSQPKQTGPDELGPSEERPKLEERVLPLSPLPPRAPAPVAADTGSATTEPDPADYLIHLLPGRPCTDRGGKAPDTFELIELPYFADGHQRMWGAGAVAGDFNGDERSDLLFLSSTQADLVLQTSDGTFQPVGADFADAELDTAFGGAAADFDGDGDVDVYVARYGLANQLLVNDGTGRFHDVAKDLGVDGGLHHSGSVTWADWDRDGDLDLLVVGHGPIDEGSYGELRHLPPGDRTLLFENLDGAQFVERPELLPQAAHDAYSFLGSFLDLNGDGRLDLYLINDLGNSQVPCQLLWNEGDHFAADNNRAGLDLALAGMGLAIGDINQDGAYDFVVPAWGKLALMKSLGGSLWVDAAQSSGVTPNFESNQEVAWATEFGDLDLDGDLDLVGVFGHLETDLATSVAGQPDAVWYQADDGTFQDLAPALGLNQPTDGRGLVLADLNDDGWLDLARPDLSGPRLLHLGPCGDGRWAKVRLRQPGLNPQAIGAEIILSAGGREHRRLILAGGSSYASSNPAEAHFGLGSAEAVDHLVVVWPDGTTSSHEGFAAGQVAVVQRLPRP